MKWFNILNEIRNAKGSKAKVAILEKNKDNDDLFEILNFLFNPRIVTGISKKKFDNNEQYAKMLYLEDDVRAKAVMNILKSNNTGKDVVVASLKQIWHMCESNLEKEMIRGLIIKDLPLGISANSINKVRPNFIPIFKLQKGKLWDGEIIENENVIVSLKLDGNSATVFNLENETYMLSRSGAIMKGFDHILAYYRNNLPKGYVYCGELIAKNYDKLKHGELFQYSNGITNSKHKEEDKKKMQHIIFDMVDYYDFKKGFSNKSFNLRKNDIQKHVKKEYDPYGSTFEDVEHITYYYEGSDFSIINDKASKVIGEGLEGLMLNFADSPYKVGPQKWLLKVKEMKTMDLEVIGIKEHVRGNKVGSLIVDYKGYEVRIPGITDELRQKWWNNPNEIVGKIVEIAYFRETTDKHGNLSLRFPSFKMIRDDKMDVSYE